ncbi:DUF86 domain-containing protein [Synechocystis sp. FACHB-383]|uniref:HepT-like ribonuclease domain-containing protein n=1 Tax=Synechocystis sp. FACHB-383 TaxID=2692864 RepID=UPI0016825FF3|nr:DUF86 domain-containing protein [Synechocystis sp. FACHB-383]MBD2653640.1 DUF86 domain-containing protein [Synechocystis sp. FACHB-383]
MSRELRLYLADIIRSIDKINVYLGNMGYDDFSGDEKTIDAVVHNLQIIGEATKQIPESLRQQYPDIPWRQVAGLRDVIAHTYFMINSAIIWDIVKIELEPLRELITLILGNETLEF